MKWLIAIMSCHQPQYVAKTVAQRCTWVEQVKDFADVVFFRGRNYSQPDFSNEVWLDVDDSYSGIPEKVRGIFAWGAERGYEYISKCDDDVYCIPSRLKELPRKGDYVGRFRGPCGGYPADFASGFFYTLSHKAARIVANTSVKQDWMDERFIGNLLAMKGAECWSDQSSYVVSGPHIRPEHIVNRAVIRDGAVFCEYHAPALYQLHEHIGYLEPVKKPELVRVRNVKLTEEILAQRPRDKAPARKVQ